MYLVIAREPCPRPVRVLHGAQVRPPEVREYAENELVVQRAVECQRGRVQWWAEAGEALRRG